MSWMLQLVISPDSTTAADANPNAANTDASASTTFYYWYTKITNWLYDFN